MKRPAIVTTFLAGLVAGVIVASVAIHHASHGGPRDASASPAPSVERDTIKPPQSAPTSPVANTVGAGSGDVFIDPAMLQNLGVRSTTVERHTLSGSIHTTGYVDYDPERLVQVNARIGGWIQKIAIAYVGQPVSRGQTLLRIYSPELVLTQEDYLRSKRLASESAKAGDSANRDGLDLMAAAVDRMRLWGISRAEIKRLEAADKVSETMPLEAPASGVITECKAVEGSHVNAGDALYTIADLSRVWVYADIYERELPHVRVGQRAWIASDALGGRKIGGSVTYIYPAVNDQTRTVKVRLEFANPHGDLKPGMYVNTAVVDESPTTALAIPAEAVLNSGLRRLVILDLGGGHFQPREITIGSESGGYFAVESGLREGDRVVTSAQFLIDSESNLHEALSAMNLRPAGPPSPHESEQR